MEILKQLSSQQGDKTEVSNKLVAEKCIANPQLLDEIATGLSNNDKKLQTDCMEVFTLVSEKNPDLTVKYAENIVPLLSSKETKMRWEAAHTLSFIADRIPEIISSVLQELQELISKDKSTIVRDYALDVVANYAKTGADNSEKSYEILKFALDLWKEKHAKQVFRGFGYVLDNSPVYKVEIKKLAEPYVDVDKKVVAAEAKKIVIRTNK